VTTPSGSGRSGGNPVLRPTLEVVAARAGVSRATASRVLRGADNVSDDSRNAVLAAADELGYRPNLAARALVTRRSDSVAFLVAESEDRLFNDPYFLGILRGAQAEVAAAGLQLIFVIASSRAEAENFEQYAKGGHVDGVLLVSLHGDDMLPQHLESIGVPTVVNGRPISGDKSLYYVDSDNQAGGQLATQALLDRGARRVATITGPLDMCAGLDRLEGYRSALRSAGRPLVERRVVTGDFTADGGAAAMARLLDTDPDVDAVFAASDLTALGAMRTIAERRLRVPEDVAVVGFDDVHEASLGNPPLTTVRQPIDELGRTMARMLVARVNGVETQRTSVLPVSLVRRGSA
jgi:DNA-binding LacI/PurR family transcriptional regulator